MFVFDSHRPLNLENTRADNRDVLVLRDEKEGEEHFPAPDSDYGESDDSSDDSWGRRSARAPREPQFTPAASFRCPKIMDARAGP